MIEGVTIKETKPEVTVENMSTIKELWVTVGKVAINVHYGEKSTLMITFTGNKWDYELDLKKELRP